MFLRYSISAKQNHFGSFLLFLYSPDTPVSWVFICNDDGGTIVVNQFSLGTMFASPHPSSKKEIRILLKQCFRHAAYFYPLPLSVRDLLGSDVWFHSRPLWSRKDQTDPNRSEGLNQLITHRFGKIYEISLRFGSCRPVVLYPTSA